MVMLEELIITLTCWVIRMKPVSDITLLVSKKTKYDDCQMNEKEKNLPRLLTYYIKGKLCDFFMRFYNAYYERKYC